MDTVIVQLASKSPDTLVVQMASKSPNTVVVWLVSRGPDTIVVQLVPKSPDTVAIRLVSSRDGFYPARVLGKQCYLWLTFSNFIKICKASSETTNKIHMWPKQCHLQSFTT